MPEYIIVEPAHRSAPASHHREGKPGNGLVKLMVFILASVVIGMMWQNGLLEPAPAGPRQIAALPVGLRTTPAVTPGGMLTGLPGTQTAVSIDSAIIANTGTALVNIAIEAGITQQASVFETEQHFRQYYDSVTQTAVERQGRATVQAARETNAVATRVQATAEMNTATAQIVQATRAAATAETWETRNLAEQNKKWVTINVIGPLSAVGWNCVVPIAAVAVLAYLGLSYAQNLALKYKQPRPAENAEYDNTPPAPEGEAPADDIPPWIRVLVPARVGNAGDWVDVQVEHGKLLQFAVGVINQRISVAEEHWIGRDGLFSARHYDWFRDSWIAAGLGKWNNPNYPRQGWSLTAEGERALRLQAFPTPARSPSKLSAPETA